MSLAHRLNELAAAHNRNLISDDDYRLLRQDLFHRSAVPEPRCIVQQPKPIPPPEPPQPTQPPLRHKGSFVSNVASLFRRKTGRSPRKPDPDLALPKRSGLRKPSMPSLRPSKPPGPPSDDERESPALKSDIAALEAERGRLLDAFAALEASTLKRIQYKTARRLYTPTPTNVSVVLQGREWRKPTKPVPSIVLPPRTTTPNHHHHPSVSMSSSRTQASDQLSVRSAASSSKASLSRSPSQQTSSPRSPRFRSTLQRQASVSSASTQSTGTSSRLATLGPRSTGNIYLASLTEHSSSRDTIADSRTEDDDDDPEAKDYASAVQELHDIRRRRDEMDARYTAKLEYIQAKLRAAELHERVSRH